MTFERDEVGNRYVIPLELSCSDDRENKNKVEPKFTLFLATTTEWFLGLAVFVFLSLLGQPAEMMPIMLFAWLLVTFGLALARIKFKEKKTVKEALIAGCESKKRIKEIIAEKNQSKSLLRRRVETSIFLAIIICYVFWTIFLEC